MKKWFRYFIGVLLFLKNVRIFPVKKIFKNKRVVVIGAADSIRNQKLKSYIEDSDYVIRLNKAVVTWTEEMDPFVGRRTDILFHGFVENFDRGGGGTLDIPLFRKFGVKYLVQPRFDLVGIRNMINFYKKYAASNVKTYLINYRLYKINKTAFGEHHPTKGYNALSTVLKSNCKEVTLIGFTFFKTPYANGYRDNIKDVESNLKHIENQGLHNAEKEFKNFCQLVKENHLNKTIKVDPILYDIMVSEDNKYGTMVRSLFK